MEAERAGSTLPHHDGRARGPTGAQRPYLFLVLECGRPLAGPLRIALHDLEAVMIGRGADRVAERDDRRSVRTLSLRVADRWMSASHSSLARVLGKWVIEDAGSRNGTQVNGKRAARAVLSDGDLVTCGHTLFLYRDAVETLPGDPAILDAGALRPPATGLATVVLPLARQLAALERVARSTVSVVIRGESGTGKEVIARAVHALSSRAGGFVAMNCGALPDALVESELFGHRKGAFSGAIEDRPGLVRSADGGTLFLDEIGDLPAPSQAAFLRVLQEREVVPVGGSKPISVDVRLVAATHRALESMVDDGAFRVDLLARIAGFTVTLPPLRERREDIGLLTAALLRRLVGDEAERVRFAPEAAEALFRYRWPANVRELEKTLGAAVVLAPEVEGGRVIELEHLPSSVRDPSAPAPGDDGGSDTEPQRTLSADEERHRDELIALLAQHAGNVTQVARAVGKARMQVHRWCRRYGIDLGAYRPR